VCVCVCAADGTRAPADVDSQGGATCRSASLLKISREIERDRLERCWRRDAAEVHFLSAVFIMLVVFSGELLESIHPSDLCLMCP